MYFSIQNLRRCKFFYIRIWRNELENFKLKPFENTKTVKFAIVTVENETRRDFMNAKFSAKSETVHKVQVNNCRVVNFMIQSLSRCKIVHSKSDTFVFEIQI